MSKQSRAHQNLEWAKQKLDEIDAMLSSLEEAVTKLSGEGRQEAERSLARIKASQSAFEAKFNLARAQAAGIGDQVYATLTAQWADVELAFQNFLTAAAGHADIVRQALLARAETQRNIWQASLESARVAASSALEQGRSEMSVSLQRLAAEAEKTQVKIGAAGDESLKAVKTGIEETRAVAERTWKKISDAFAAAL